MKIFFTALAVLSLSLSTFAQSSDKAFEPLLAKCEGFNSGKYTCWPYVQAAVYLQTLDKIKIIEILKDYANTGKYEDQIIVLTRMFVQSHLDVPLRRPMLGGAVFLGGTDYDEWGSEPIELSNKVPFLIVMGYELGGQAERSIDYLEYCLANGNWTANNYKIRQDDLRSALNLLIDSRKWPTPLTSYEKAFLEGQIK